MTPNSETTTTTWMTRKEAALHMRLSPATLANWASLDYGPAFTRIGQGRVLYRMADVESWMALQTRLAV